MVNGFNKNQLKDRLTEILSEYIIEPEVEVTIIAYLSKVFYVVGEVSRPGKFYMRGNTVSTREALMQAGLPTHSAALRGCRLIKPAQQGQNNFEEFDALRLIYEGDLTENLDMQPGDVLYVPSTVIAKLIRVVSPVTNLGGQAAGAALTGAALVP